MQRSCSIRIVSNKSWTTTIIMAAKFAGKYDQTGIENAEEFYKALGKFLR